MTPPPPFMPTGNHVPAFRSLSEKKLGILHHTSPLDFGWHGDIRKRYTDFLVNEVRKDGTVLHLTQFELGDQNTQQQANGVKKEVKVKSEPDTPTHTVESVQISNEDVQALNDMVGSAATNELLNANVAILNKTAPKGLAINLAVVVDRDRRTRIHQEIRRIFSSCFETQVESRTNMITATIATRANTRTPSKNWRDGSNSSGGRSKKGGGNYLHFTLYKENKDTMDAINHIARMLKIKSSNFGFAGTKDRRAATSQRVSVWHQGTAGLNWLNAKANNIKVGDFSSQKAPIQLGQHGGNDFIITIKNVELTRGNEWSLKHRLVKTEKCVQTALDHVLTHGFINYFGLQRFGTHAIGTQEVGLKILSGDFEGAIDYILHVEPGLLSKSISQTDLEAVYHRDELNRGKAIAMWKTTGDLDSAVKLMPKRYNAELSIMRHLGKSQGARRDYCGALLQITRGLRNLYIHAYQSYIWNWVASERWAKYGDKVIVGDIVLVEPDVNPANFREGKDMSEDINQEEEEFYQQGRTLTAEDVESGAYTIFDIVLPVPGYDVLYPNNEIGDFYAELMGRKENGELDPYHMRRRQKEFSLSGHYRKLLARFTTTPKFVVRPYFDDAEQMHPTDLDEIKQEKQKEAKLREELREEMREASSGWRHFAGNSKAFDDAEFEMRRRRRAAERSSEPPETRINDMWVETALDGSSKRIKVNQHPVVHGAAAAAITRVKQENTPSSSDHSKKPLFTPASDDVFSPAASSHGGRHGAVLGVLTNGQAQPSDGPATDAFSKSSILDTPAPMTDIPGFSPPLKPTTVETPAPMTNIPGFDGPASSVETPAPMANIPGFSPVKPELVDTPAPMTDIPGFSPVQPPSALANGRHSEERVSTTGGVVHAGKADDKVDIETLKAEALEAVPENVFKNATKDSSDGKAMNLTDERHRKFPVNEMKIAVIVNFRLSSSNYATICLREVMGAFSTETPAPVAPATSLPVSRAGSNQ